MQSISRDAAKIKERIVAYLKQNGPSLPVHIAKDASLSILFTSAFLSELLSDKMLKMSNMRVGSSQLFFIDGQEPMLEKFSTHLKPKEKEAYTILKEKRFLKDLEQLPAIRAALREIKDFAFAFKKNDQVIWRFFTVPESEFIEEEKPIITPIPLPVAVPIAPVLEVIEDREEKIVLEEVSEPIKEKKVKDKKKPRIKTKAVQKKRISSKSKYDEKFLERVKEFLSNNAIEIMNIEGLKKDELLLRIKVDGSEQLLVAYKKKKISENEIIKTAKKASEMNLKYSILTMGELPKKISGLIQALQNIKEIRKVE